MDFITILLSTLRQHDSIVVLVDNLSKEDHFIVVKSTNLSSEVAPNFMSEISRLHKIPNNFILDRYVNFTSMFSKDFFAGLAVELDFSKLIIHR